MSILASELVHYSAFETCTFQVSGVSWSLIGQWCSDESFFPRKADPLENCCSVKTSFTAQNQKRRRHCRSKRCLGGGELERRRPTWPRCGRRPEEVAPDPGSQFYTCSGNTFRRSRTLDRETRTSGWGGDRSPQRRNIEAGPGMKIWCGKK